MTKFLRPGDPRDILAAKWELEFEDVFHLKEFYRTAHEWLEENGWGDPEGGKWEYVYHERVLPPEGAKEHRWWWRISQQPNGSKYVRYFMTADFRTLNMRQVSTVVGGKKYKTWKGSLVIYCDAYVQLDYLNKWKNHWFLKYFEEFFRNRMYKEYWDEHKLEVYKKCYKFNRELKNYWKLRSPVKEPKLFRMQKGVPSE